MLKKYLFAMLVMVLFLVSCSSAKGKIDLTVQAEGEVVHVTMKPEVTGQGRINLYRSTENLHEMFTMNLTWDPIVKWSFPMDSLISFRDSTVPHGVKVYYYASIPGEQGSAVKSIKTPSVMLPGEASAARIVIDKQRYTLTVMDGDAVLKRYAVNLGRNPQNRKLHQDNASTPEGRYTLTYFKENSSFHRSMGVSYPNREDWSRYSGAKARGEIPKENGKYRSIGGAITIHGGGVGNNWTFGCIALENSDVDEIMDSGIVGVGTPILIAGGEVSLAELLKKDTAVVRR